MGDSTDIAVLSLPRLTSNWGPSLLQMGAFMIDEANISPHGARVPWRDQKYKEVGQGDSTGPHMGWDGLAVIRMGMRDRLHYLRGIVLRSAPTALHGIFLPLRRLPRQRLTTYSFELTPRTSGQATGTWAWTDLHVQGKAW